ncbi:nif domain protein [Diplodia corticola]|uniref:Nif domain protein n=1 Tax=Diplodia corticola TaxID=236234 RepID=A0A1J9QJI8_9PEZI|nr:nif domain protein [Diplodia corticola]OJD29030.1 nif domain protein [Diplodia corticola]
METSTLIPLTRYCCTTSSSASLAVPHLAPHHNNCTATDQDIYAQMARKKNAKKLNRQQPQQTAAPVTPAVPDGQLPPHPLLQSIAPPMTQLPFPPTANNAAAATQPNGAQEPQQDGQSKKSKKKQRARERRGAKKQQLQQQKQQQAASVGQGQRLGSGTNGGGYASPINDVTTTAAATELRDGEEDNVLPNQHGGSGDDHFVGQPLLDVLDGVHLQQSGSEAEAARVGQPGDAGGGRRASLARRPAAQQDVSGPPPGAPTQPRAARMNAAAAPPPGAPTGPKSMASFSAWSQRPAAAGSSHAQPQYGQQPAAADTVQASTFGANCQVPGAGSGSGNPFGYHLQNATWDWNTFGGASDAAAASYLVEQSNEAGGDFDGNKSHPHASNDRIAPGTESEAAWPSAYGDATSGFLQQQQQQQQNYYDPYQSFGQYTGWNPYLQQHQQQQQSIGLQPGYYNPTFQSSSGLRYIHGHTNSFTPFAPMASVQHYYQGHRWHVDKRYSAPTRGFASKAGKNGGGGRASPGGASDNSDGGVKVGSSEPVRRSKRLAAKGGDGAIQAQRESGLTFEGAMDNKQQMKSPSPGHKSRAPNPPRWKKPLGPPQPHPTSEYLARASQEPERLTKEPHKLLIVIDLNGTLVHRPRRNKKNSQIISRPYVSAFLDYLIANHRVMVWSSAKPVSVEKMVASLMPSANRRDALLAEWGRDRLGLSPKAYDEKVQVYKELDKVWKQADEGRWHPLHAAHQKGEEPEPEPEQATEANRFGQHNTFLIDDSLLKASSEPHNLIQVEEFEARPHQMQTDVLRQVVGYLEEAKWWSNVSAWVNRGNRFEVGKGWDHGWPEGTTSGLVPPPEAVELERQRELELQRDLERQRDLRASLLMPGCGLVVLPRSP